MSEDIVDIPVEYKKDHTATIKVLEIRGGKNPAVLLTGTGLGGELEALFDSYWGGSVWLSVDETLDIVNNKAAAIDFFNEITDKGDTK